MALSSPRPSGGGSGGGLRSGRVSAPVTRQAAPRGPGFVDIGRLLSANRAGAQRMADSLQNSVREAGDAASKEIADAEKTFDDGVKAGTVVYNPATTSGDAETQGQKTFSGPQTWEAAGINTGKIAQNAAAAQDKAANLANDYGRAALLREQVKGPYSAGMSGLDAALTGAAGGAALQQTVDTYKGLSQRLIDARGGAGAKVDKATKDSAAAAGQYRDQVPVLQRQEQARVEAANAAEAARQEQIMEERRRRAAERQSRGNYNTNDGRP